MSILAQNNIIDNPFNTTEDSEEILFEEKQNKFEELSEFLRRSKSLIDSETDAYLLERAKENEGVYELWGTTKEEIERILRHNKFWEIFEREKKRERKEREEAYKNRLNIPPFKTKKALEDLKKEVFNTIRELDQEYNKGGRESIFLELEIEGYEEKLKKIKALLKTSINKDFNSDLLKAKTFPIENIIEFNRAGFAKCPFHGNGMERTPSLKLYKNRNKCHCFSCGKDADPIDVIMQLNNISLSEAVKKLIC